MGRTTDRQQRPGYGRLLDAWIRSDGAGEPVGVVATSFTFNAAFFEEECLARFLGMESDPIEDGAVYLIEREEKLASISCAAVLVDQHHCRGTRSLRWDLHPARVSGGGILHAKVNLLYWSNLVRVIVASANLTEDGYRRNREIFGVLDFVRHGETDANMLADVIAFLRSLLPVPEAEGPDAARVRGLLAQVEDYRRGLQAAKPARRGAHSSTTLVVSRPDGADVISRLQANWPGGSPPSLAYVTSPFFDNPGKENRPARALWAILRQRGKAKVTFHVVVEEIPGETTVLIRAPESLRLAQPMGRASVETYFTRVPLEDDTGDGKAVFRPLHLKSLWIEGERWAMYLIGSSNFTSAGLGLGPVRNVEANLLYLFRVDSDDELAAGMGAACLAGDPIDPDAQVRWEAAVDDELEAAKVLEVLPEGFGAAIYGVESGGVPYVEFHLGDDLPDSWDLKVPLANHSVLDSAGWTQAGKTPCLRIPWADLAPPSGFEVRWPGAVSPAWLPVVVQEASVLPPPDELKALPLELLIQVLTSSRSLHEVMRRWLKSRRSAADQSRPDVEIDPHVRVDTAAFLLQRTRRMAWALEALKGRLARPAVTQEALDWRLSGPVGVRTLAEAILREARSDAERAFLLGELALTLAQVEPITGPDSLPAKKIKKAIRVVIRDLKSMADRLGADHTDNLANYVERAFAAAMS